MQLDTDRIIRQLGPRRNGAVRSLVTHPRVYDLIQEGGTYIYIDRLANDKHVMLVGLTKQLLRLYWPAYRPTIKTQNRQMRKIKEQNGRLRAVRQRRQKLLDLARKRHHGLAFAPAQESARGAVRGSIVHRQLHQWVMLDLANFARLNPRHPADDDDAAAHEHSGLTALLESLDQHRQCPVAVEYKVACTNPLVKLATGIDLVTVNGDGRLTFIELKTVNHSYLFHGDEPAIPFEGVLRSVVDEWNERHPEQPLLRSACTRAMVQLAMAVWMLVEGHGHAFKLGDFDIRVVVVPDFATAYQVEWVPVSAEFMLEVGAPVYRNLKQELADWRRQQAQARKRVRDPPHAPPPQRDDDDDDDGAAEDAVEPPQKRRRRDN